MSDISEILAVLDDVTNVAIGCVGAVKKGVIAEIEEAVKILIGAKKDIDDFKGALPEFKALGLDDLGPLLSKVQDCFEQIVAAVKG